MLRLASNNCLIRINTCLCMILVASIIVHEDSPLRCVRAEAGIIWYTLMATHTISHGHGVALVTIGVHTHQIMYSLVSWEPQLSNAKNVNFESMWYNVRMHSTAAWEILQGPDRGKLSFHPNTLQIIIKLRSCMRKDREERSECTHTLTGHRCYASVASQRWATYVTSHNELQASCFQTHRTCTCCSCDVLWMRNGWPAACRYQSGTI